MLFSETIKDVSAFKLTHVHVPITL